MTRDTQEFLDLSSGYLAEDYLPKIRAAVGKLSEDDVWWKPNAASNSIGNLLLHLSGNLGQWVVSAVGGRPDERQRHLEFDPDQRPSPDAMLDRLATTVGEACEVLANVDHATLGELRTIQGREVTCFEAIYHAVEHFSMHTGQILYIAKLRTGSDLNFYELVDGLPKAIWKK